MATKTKKTEEQKDAAANATLSKAAKAHGKKGKKAEAAPTAPKTTRAPRNNGPKVAGDAKITLLRKDNPKRGASADRYKLYKSGMTVDDYVKAGGFRADIAWDMEREFIKVS